MLGILALPVHPEGPVLVGGAAPPSVSLLHKVIPGSLSGLGKSLKKSQA